MEKNAIIVIAVVAILAGASAGAFLVLNNDKGNGLDDCSLMDDAQLKVFGNINGDMRIDSKDVDLIQTVIDNNGTVEDYPLADANRDGVIDSKDIDVVKNIIAGKSTVIYHINYHDVDGNGVMDEEIVSTKFPVTSALTTGSTNTFLTLFMLGIVDEIKGASYSKSTVESALFGDVYLDTNKVEFLGDNSGEIHFEDGKVGSSEIIKQKNVTCVITDWNSRYIPNEPDFEKNNIDVVHVASASTDIEVITHSELLLGLLFQKVDRSISLVELNTSVADKIKSVVSKTTVKPKAVASSMTEYISSPGSDYTDVLIAAGAEFGLEGFDFGSKTSIKVADNKNVFNTNLYNYDYVIHLRTGNYYAGLSDADIDKLWGYTGKFSDWNNAATGNYVISGGVPVMIRVAYTAAAFYDDISFEWADGLHQKYVDDFFDGKDFNVSESTFYIHNPVQA